MALPSLRKVAKAARHPESITHARTIRRTENSNAIFMFNAIDPCCSVLSSSAREVTQSEVQKVCNCFISHNVKVIGRSYRCSSLGSSETLSIRNCAVKYKRFFTAEEPTSKVKSLRGTSHWRAPWSRWTGRCRNCKDGNYHLTSPRHTPLSSITTIIRSWRSFAERLESLVFLRLFIVFSFRLLDRPANEGGRCVRAHGALWLCSVHADEWSEILVVLRHSLWEGPASLRPSLAWRRVPIETFVLFCYCEYFLITLVDRSLSIWKWR